jgi:hypothetical protein
MIQKLPADDPPPNLPETPVGQQKSGRIVRIGTALGSFLVVIVNDLGPAADPLAGEIERDVIDRLRAHRHIAEEMAIVDLQRGDLDYELIHL